jgi:uncharacterized SAM-binding protein YcdF (DUF218 family)
MGWDLFHFKKLFESVLLSQPSLSIIICSIGLLLWIARPKAYVGLGLIFLGLFWLFVTSLPITGYLMGRFLELEARAKLHGTDLRLQKVAYIVVLNRNVAQAARIRNEIPNAKLIILCPEYCKKTADNALRLGIPIEDIFIKKGARDTAEQAAQLKSLLGTQRFILCTTALHTPRAVLTFKLSGMNPIPAPYHFIAKQDSMIHALQPSRHGWHLVNLATHEYVGALWLEISRD